MLIRKAAEKQTKDAEMTDRSRRAKEKKPPQAPRRISMQWTCYCTEAHQNPWSNDIGRSTCYYMSPSGMTCPGVRDIEDRLAPGRQPDSRSKAYEEAGIMPSCHFARQEHYAVKREEIEQKFAKPDPVFDEIAGFEKWRCTVERVAKTHNTAAMDEKPAWFNEETQYMHPHNRTSDQHFYDQWGGVGGDKLKPESHEEITGMSSNFMNPTFKLQDSFWQCDCNFVNLSAENWLTCKNCKGDRMHCNVGLMHTICTILNPQYEELNFDHASEQLSKNIIHAAWFSAKIAKIFAIQYMDMSTYNNEYHLNSLHLTVEWFGRILEHFKEILDTDPEDFVDILLKYNCEYEACKQALEERKKKELEEEKMKKEQLEEEAAYDPYEVVNRECIICFDEITESEDPTINNFCLMPCGHTRVCSMCVGMLRATGEECPDCALGIEATVIYHPTLPNLTLVRSQGHTYSYPPDHFQEGPWNARW